MTMNALYVMMDFIMNMYLLRIRKKQENVSHAKTLIAELALRLELHAQNVKVAFSPRMDNAPVAMNHAIVVLAENHINALNANQVIIKYNHKQEGHIAILAAKIAQIVLTKKHAILVMKDIILTKVKNAKNAILLVKIVMDQKHQTVQSVLKDFIIMGIGAVHAIQIASHAKE